MASDEQVVSKDPDQAWRAIDHGMGQIWDALRGMSAAYQVDTGREVPVAIPAWDDLSEHHKILFIAPAGVVTDLLELTQRDVSAHAQECDA